MFPVITIKGITIYSAIISYMYISILSIHISTMNTKKQANRELVDYSTIAIDVLCIWLAISLLCKH